MTTRTKSWYRTKSFVICFTHHDLEKAIPKAVPSLRNVYIAELSREYAKSKRYDRALELLHKVAAESTFPYRAAVTLMLYLPPDPSSERQNIFSEALAAYEASPGSDHIRLEDMATLVIRFQDKLPAPLIMEATEQILDRAKQQREEDASHHFEIGSRNGSVTFESLYELRLFQLLPVIQKLDESKAKQLLRENPKMEAVLRRYPQGLQSLDTGLTSTPGPKGEHSDIFTISYGPIPNYDTEKDIDAIYTLARRDPKQALERAMSRRGNLEQRAQTLVIVGNIVAEQDPSVARIALKEGVRLSADCEPVFRFDNLKSAGDSFLRMGDNDTAATIIATGTKFAEELYAKDTDSTNPNAAIKAQWPSTNVWLQFVGLAARISPQMATGIIDQVPDPEILVFLRVALASSLMGREPRTIRAVRRNQEREVTEFW